MNTAKEHVGTAERKVMKLLKALSKARDTLKKCPRSERTQCREDVHDLTSKLSWELIECDRYEESYALARTLPWRTHAEDRYLREGTSLTKHCLPLWPSWRSITKPQKD